MANVSFRTLVRAMVAEEWRLHSSLFGSRRFAVFPLLILGLVAGTVMGLTTFGVPVMGVILGLHVLVLVFGLQTGSIVFLGEDALDNMLGETTFLMYSARTLPVSQRRLLASFLVKDLLYYAVLFITPITLGLTPLLVDGVVSPAVVAASWVGLTVSFVGGLLCTVIGLSLRSHRVGRLVAVASVFVIGGLVVGWSVSPVALVPYAIVNAVVTDASVAVVTGQWLAVLAGLTVLAGVVFDSSGTTQTRTVTARYRGVSDAVAGPRRLRPIIAKTLLDIHRSSGGYFKLVFSAGLLAGVVAYLLDLSQQVTGQPPVTGLAFGSLLGLVAFPTYNWLTQLDDPAEYQHLPYTVADVFRAKRVAFVQLVVPVGVAYYAMAIAVYGSDVVPALVGLGVLVTVAHFMFAITVSIAGYQPNEFLFDVVQFAKFTAANLVGIVPILVVGLFVSALTRPVLVGIGGYLVVANLVAVGVWRRAVPRWERRLRAV